MPKKCYGKPVTPRFVAEKQDLYQEVSESELFKKTRCYDSKLEILCNDFFHSLTSEKLDEHLSVEILDKPSFESKIDWVNLELNYNGMDVGDVCSYYNHKTGEILRRGPVSRLLAYYGIAHELGHYVANSNNLLKDEINAYVISQWAIKKLEIEKGVEVSLTEQLDGIHAQAKKEALSHINKNGFVIYA